MANVRQSPLRIKWCLIIIKVYANSLLAVLNSRVVFGPNSRDASDSTELSTNFHASAVAHHRNNILSQVCNSYFILVLLCYLIHRERSERGTVAEQLMQIKIVLDL